MLTDILKKSHGFKTGIFYHRPDNRGLAVPTYLNYSKQIQRV